MESPINVPDWNFVGLIMGFGLGANPRLGKFCKGKGAILSASASASAGEGI